MQRKFSKQRIVSNFLTPSARLKWAHYAEQHGDVVFIDRGVEGVAGSQVGVGKSGYASTYSSTEDR